MRRFAPVFRFLLAVGVLGGVAIGCSSTRQASVTAPLMTGSSGISTDPQVNAILVRSCYGCHSTEGATPWYATIAPTYLAANSARAVLNFSAWRDYDAQKRASELAVIAQSVSSGSMPPGDYTILDSSARLTAEAKQLLLDWTSQAAATMPAQ